MSLALGSPLPVLAEVAQNGVATISSVSGDGMALCEQAVLTMARLTTANRLAMAVLTMAVLILTMALCEERVLLH